MLRHSTKWISNWVNRIPFLWKIYLPRLGEFRILFHKAQKGKNKFIQKQKMHIILRSRKLPHDYHFGVDS